MRFKQQPVAAVVGLDMSLTRTAMVTIPVAWDLDFTRVAWATVGMKLKKDATEIERAKRCDAIADTIVQHIGEAVRLHGRVAVFVEGYSFASGYQAHQLGELRGVVRKEVIATIGRAPTPIPCNTCRQTFFGYTPKGKGTVLKAQIVKGVERTGATLPNHDVADAFLVANAGLAASGFPAVTLASG